MGDQLIGSSGFAVLNTAYGFSEEGCTMGVLACLRHFVGSAGALYWLSAAQMMLRNPSVRSLGHVRAGMCGQVVEFGSLCKI